MRFNFFESLSIIYEEEKTCFDILNYSTIFKKFTHIQFNPYLLLTFLLASSCSPREDHPRLSTATLVVLLIFIRREKTEKKIAASAHDWYIGCQHKHLGLRETC